MKLYNKELEKLHTLRDMAIKLDTETATWQVLEQEEMILRMDTAFELGGGEHAAVSGLAFTTDEQEVGESGVYLLGSDLTNIHEDCDYARFTLVRLKNTVDSHSDSFFRVLRKIAYTRFHIFLKGFMMRVSSAKEREPVRISKQAVQNGISFASVGAKMLDLYLMNENVAAVQIYFITDKDANYDELKKIAHTMEQITDSTNHIFEGLVMDCSVCNLKEICDEVEGLKELHFSQQG